MDGHVESDMLIRFVAGELAAAEVPDVFGHLAHCESCRTRVHALRAIAADPDAAWACLPLDVADAPADAPAASGIRWATLCVVVDAARRVAAVTVETLARTAAGDWICRPVFPSPGVGDAAAPCRVTASEARVEMELQGVGVGTVTVVADARRDAVAVILEPPPAEAARQQLLARAPRAVLADEQGLVRHSARLEPVVGATYLLAEFERPDGTNWLLSLEFEN